LKKSGEQRKANGLQPARAALGGEPWLLTANSELRTDYSRNA